MEKTEFEELQNSISSEYEDNHFISEERIIEYIEMINSWDNYKADMEAYNKETVKISEMFSLFWGVLSLTINNGNCNSNMLKTCTWTLSAQIANNALAIIKLAINGFDFQAGILLRNTYEISFTLLNIMIDKDKCKLYFETAKKGNERDVWKKNFNISNLNRTLEKFENNFINDSDNLSFLIDWRKNQYKHYSGYVHNDLLCCYSNIFTKLKYKDETMSINLWGENATRINRSLNTLNDLMFYTCNVFYKIISVLIVNKEQLCNSYEEFWNDAFIIKLMVSNLYHKNFNEE